MNRALFLGILLYALLLLGLASVNGDLLALAVPLALYLLVSAWSVPTTVDLDVRRELSVQRVNPGQAVILKVEVVNRGSTLEELTVVDDLPAGLTLLDGTNRHVIRLAAGRAASWTYTVSGPRGDYVFAPLRVTAGEALGLFKRDESLAAPARLLVLPSVPRLRNIAIRPRRTRVYAGTIPARVGGAAVDFFGVREYQTGDPPRRINWHLSARQADG